MSLEPLAWDEPQHFGISHLDNAHAELLCLYNRIVRACAGQTPNASPRERIRTFLFYARWHFGDEETYMQHSHYPDIVAHQADHRKLLQDAEDFVDNLGEALSSEDAPAIVSYFHYWLRRHMAHHDSDLLSFMRHQPH